MIAWHILVMVMAESEVLEKSTDREGVTDLRELPF